MVSTAPAAVREFEEAWIVQALVREDGISQMEVAELLGRHKSWVCRHRALVERLGAKARDDLGVGLEGAPRLPQATRLKYPMSCGAKLCLARN